MSGRIARAPLRLLRLGGVRRALQPLLRARATVFMLHRFRNPELGTGGHDPDAVRALLGQLRRDGFRFATLRSVFEALQAGEPLDGAIAFTIDDGYADQAHVAGPLFAEFDCPVSTFLCTGFLDGQFWMWWDRIEYALERTPRRQLDLPGLALRWTDDAGRASEQLRAVEHVKRLPEAQKRPFVDALAAQAEVELPASPPARYAPMSWDDARKCEAQGMSFGPHTLTHAILSTADAEQARREIDGSRQRLAQELRSPDPIFCYPNGQADDFGSRECGILASLGFAGAVTGLPGHAEAGSGNDWLYRIRRFSFPENRDDLLQCVSGFEQLKASLRARL
jgi:peptidoglycan/xylan/chitin deacetylase (PgdA/CDA1 family)